MSERRHDPTDHDCKGGVVGDRYPLDYQPAAHPADSAEALLREAAQRARNRMHNLDPARADPGITQCIAILDEEIRAAPQTRQPADGGAGDCQGTHHYGLCTSCGKYIAAAEGSEPLDVARLTDAVMFAGNYVDVEEAREMAREIAAAYASQRAEAMSDHDTPTKEES